jgi:Mrp family chromosome partitioning ATPase
MRPVWDAGRFADEQISRLVRQVFWPGWPKPARHVVVSAVDDDTNVAGICLHIGQNLAHQVEGRVGVIEANLAAPEFENAFGVKASTPRATVVPMGNISHQIADRLWLEPCASFWGDAGEAGSPPASAVEQLRHEFDFAVVHAAPAGSSSQAMVLGHLCDGVILVVEAHCTHRVVAQAVKETLQAAKVRVLGVVLSGRRFPVPENFYRRL